MKILKWLVVTLVGLAAVVVGGGLLLTPTFTVVRSVEIAAPADKVAALVEAPRQWARWTVWNRRDPAMTMRYEGPERGTGASWSWESASEGSGRMVFTQVDPGQRVVYELSFPEFDTTSTGELRLAPLPAGTWVTWTMNGDMGANPVWRWFALFMDRMVGPDFEAGLANLKSEAEKI